MLSTKLQNAKALLQKGWVQGPYAINILGDRCHPKDTTAVAFCFLGALAAADVEDGSYGLDSQDITQGLGLSEGRHWDRLMIHMDNMIHKAKALENEHDVDIRRLSAARKPAKSKKPQTLRAFSSAGYWESIAGGFSSASYSVPRGRPTTERNPFRGYASLLSHFDGGSVRRASQGDHADPRLPATGRARRRDERLLTV